MMKSAEVYGLMFRNYPDVVNIEQLCEMLGGISTKTGYRLLKAAQSKVSSLPAAIVSPKSISLSI